MVRVVVVGCGYAGVAAAGFLENSLPKDSQIIVIEPKDYFYHNVGAVRSSVDPAFIPNTIMSSERLFRKSGNLILHAYVTEIDRSRVVLDRNPAEASIGVVTMEGDKYVVTFDYVIIATGSSYTAPFKSETSDKKAMNSVLQKIAQRVKDSENIVLIGGGPVGVETAGEIKHLYPNKKVTIITASDKIIPGQYLEKLREKLLGLLKNDNVEIVYGARVTNLPDNLDDQLKPQTISLNNGQSFQTDMVFVCSGSEKPLTKINFKFEFSVLNEREFIKVEPTMVIKGTSNVFSIGDASTADIQKLAFLATEQAKIAVKNICQSIRAKAAGVEPKLSVYKAPGSQNVIFVTYGPKKGAGQFPFGSYVAGSFLVGMIKAKDLFSKKYLAMLHYAKAA